LTGQRYHMGYCSCSHAENAERENRVADHFLGLPLD
jgi:hypothetical protein